MPLAQPALAQLDSAQEFFNRSTRSLTEEHSGVRPAPGMMTAAQQVANAAHTIGWLIEGTFRPEGFDTDFDAHAKIVEGLRVARRRARLVRQGCRCREGDAVHQERC